MRIESPYHQGELLVQQQAGEVEQGRRNGRAISNTIIRGALNFIKEQPFAVLGSVDAQNNVWASLLVGERGFMSADEHTVELDLKRAGQNPHDPFWVNIENNPRIGMLVIELSTRRRLRINGQVAHHGQDQIRIHVDEMYPNCPKYIQRRHIAGRETSPPSALARARAGTSLEALQRSLIATADTFFVASSHPTGGVDASHRGGPPGFIRVMNDSRIRVPDYVGNSMFNTLGNFAVNPRGGLVFLDFERNCTLQLIGRPEILWNREDPANQTGGTRRFWDFYIERWLELDLPKPVRWEFLDYSPHNPKLA